MASSAYSFLDLLAIFLTCILPLLRLQVIYFVFPVFVCTWSGLKVTYVLLTYWTLSLGFIKQLFYLPNIYLVYSSRVHN